MGLRFRKSINLGCGFRINFSKSGIGYSFGGKGLGTQKPHEVLQEEHYLFREQVYHGLRKEVEVKTV